MDSTIRALEEVSRLYRELRVSLSESPDQNLPTEAPGAAEATLRSAPLIRSLERATARLAALSAWWRQHRERLAPGDRDRVCGLAETARTELSQTLACCNRHSSALMGRKTRIEADLGRIRKGARFLQSTRPAKTNYPKFIDSRG